MAMDRQGWRLIGFVCTAPGHLAGSAEDRDKLTIHRKSWAFCPFDTKAEGHEWSASTVGNVTKVAGFRHLTELQRSPSN